MQRQSDDQLAIVAIISATILFTTLIICYTVYSYKDLKTYKETQNISYPMEKGR